ncbi:hypothetical protein U91I_04218 [alpha proteobacterium U9-1i]|nr:hypothetical protein U91I_04218 [alpha proteobacterium U9-1i]
MLKTIFAVLCAVALNACASAPPAQPQSSLASSITLFEGGCFYTSSCTSYDITVQAGGAYRLDGRTQGVSEGQLSAEAFAAAESALAAAHFESLPEVMNGSDLSVWRPDVYPCMNHAPGMRITRRMADGSEQAVYWDQGCRSAQMSALLNQMRAAFHYDDLVSRTE